MDVLGGGSTTAEFGDQYFFTNPRCETGDERYAWLNQTFLVGQGRISRGRRSSTRSSGSRTDYVTNRYWLPRTGRRCER